VNCQAEPVKPSTEINHVLNLQYTVEVSITRTLYSRVNTQGESHCGRLSGNQEDKLDWRGSKEYKGMCT